MPERFENDVPMFRAPDLIEQFQPLPGWLADRLLRSDEKVEWVRGPWFNPSWEQYVTHPGLLLLPLVFGVLGLSLVWTHNSEVIAAFVLVAVLFFVLTIIVLGIANGYFTRLVVTDSRLVILQGYEICRTWNIRDLPPALLHYGRHGDDTSRTLDLNAVKKMLGGSSDKFTDAKTILSFGKQLDRITTRDKDHR